MKTDLVFLHSFLDQKLQMFPWTRSFTSLLSTGWFQERVQGWYHNGN